MSNYEFSIDGSGAEAGADRIVKSFDSIRAAATRMEGGVVAAANKMVSAFSSLNNIKAVNQKAIEGLRGLSDAMGKFRGPSKTSVQNTVDLFTSLGKFGSLRLPSTAGLANFLNVTNRYAGPTPQAGKNLNSLINALNKFNGITGAGARVTAFLNALGSYRGPSANAGKNVSSLFNALNGFKGLPRGFASSSEAFIKFAAAVDKAAASMRNLKGESNFKVPNPVAPTNRGGSGGGLSSVGGVRGLTREYGLLETAVFRTHSAMNALGGVLAAKYIVNAANDLLKIRAQLVAATGSSAQAATQFAYLQAVSNKLGLDLRSTAQSYGKFLGSVKGTKTDILDAQKIFDGFATAGRALQLSVDDMDGIFRALGQIMSKGKLQAEELRGQLGDRLPGAFSRMAAALGMSTTELDAAMKKGLISGQKLQDGLMNMATMLKIEFTPSAEEASKTVDAAFNRMGNAFLMAAGGLGKSGMNEGLINIADSITNLLQSDALATFLQGLGMAFKVVGDNANFFGAVLAGALVASTAKWAMQLKGLLGMAGPLSDLFKNAGAAFNSGYARGAGAVGGVQPSAGQAAAAATSQSAAAGMNTYAASATAAAAASAEESAAAAQAATNTAAAGNAATVSATGFDAQAAAATRSGAALNRVAAQNTAAVNSAAGLGGTIRASVPALDQQAVKFNAAGNAAASYGSRLGGLAANTKTATSTIAASWTNQIPSQARFAASTSQLAASLKTVGTAAALNAAPLGSLGTAAAGLATSSTVAATGLGGLSAAAGAATGTAGALGTSLTGAAVAGTEAAAGTSLLTGSANGLSAAGVVTTNVVRGLAVAEGQAAGAAVAQSLATRALAAATGYATGALAVFRAVLVTVPFVAVAVGVAALIGYVSSLSSASDEAKKKVGELSGAQSTGRQIAADYSDWVDANTNALDKQSRALQNNTLKTIENNLAKASNATFDIKSRVVKAGQEVDPSSVRTAVGLGIGSRGLANGTNKNAITRTYTRGGAVFGEGQTQLGSADASELLKLAIREKDGTISSRGTPKSAQQYEAGRMAVARLQKQLDSGTYGADEAKGIQDLVDYSNKVYDAVAMKQQLGRPVGFDALGIDSRLNKQYHVAPRGQDAAAAAAGGDKGKKGDGGAAAALNQDEQDLRRAMEGVRDLNREISSADAAIASLRGAGGTAVASEASNAAMAQLNNIEDAFNTAGRGKEGIEKFAARLRADAVATADAVALVEKAAANPASVTDTAKLQAAAEMTKGLSEDQIDAIKRLAAANVEGYDNSKKALQSYLTSQQQLKAERQKELDLTKQINDANIEVASKTGGVIPGTTVSGVARRGVDLVAAAKEGGRALQEATLKQEAMTQAVGVSAAEYDNYVDRLYKAKLAQAELNVQLEQAAKLHDQAAERAALLDTQSLYQRGGSQRDIEAQLSINAMQRDMVDKGWSSEMINGVIAQEKELANLRVRVDEVRDAYDRLQQVSQDLSDAIVGGFRDAMEGTKSFGSALGDVFKQMKKIILDFVLYNPLRNFLQNALQGSLGGGGSGLFTAPNASGVASMVSTNATSAAPPAAQLNLFSAGASLFADVFDSGATKMATSVGPAIQNVFETAGTAPPSQRPGWSVGSDGGPSEIVVRNSQPRGSLLNTALNMSQQDYFAPLKAVFNYKSPQIDPATNQPMKDKNGQTVMVSNFSKLKDGFKDIGSAFGDSVKGVGGKLNALGKGLGKVAGVAGQAFAAFSIAKVLGEAIGLGETGSNVLGGAAAGFSVAGPVGAVVGAGIGLIGTLLFGNKKPQARADVTVGADGRVGTSNVYSKDGGDRKGAVALAGQAGGVFQKVADTLDATLSAGNYGTFGSAKKIKGDVKTFYSTTGKVDKKGRPIGQEGVDFLIAGPDELAAFALKAQIRSDKFQNLDPIYKTIANNTTATTTDALNSDLSVGKAYLEFVDQAKGYTNVEKAAKDLKDSYESLAKQSKALGVDTAQLTKAYEKMRKTQKTEFDFGINQGILGIKDPLMAEYNQLVKEYSDAVKGANAVGGDLVKVEEYYGLQRTELIKKYLEQSNNAIKTAADDLYRQLTATEASPLSAQTVFNNAQDQYTTLANQIKGGDYTNVDKLATYSQDYLSSAQAIFSSGSEFFQVFSQVTDFLKYVSANAPAAAGTDPNTLPDLPALTTIQEQIKASNDELKTSTDEVGTAVLEGNATLQQILEELRKNGYGGIRGLGLNPALLNNSGTLTTVGKS